MSNPIVAPRYSIRRATSSTPEAFLPENEQSDLLKLMRAKKRSTDFMAGFLKGKDVRVADSVLLNDVVEHIHDLDVKQKVLNAGPNKPVFALAGNEGLTARKRNLVARSLLDKVYPLLPSRDEPKDRKWSVRHSSGYAESNYAQRYDFETREACAEQMREKLYVFGGTQYTLGRLQAHYPDVGVTGLKKVSSFEAKAALRRCGLDLSGSEIDKRPFEVLMINPTSDNGLPVLGKWTASGEAAQKRIFDLAVTIRGALASERFEYGAGVLQERTAIMQAVRALEQRWPFLFTLLGKAKADTYTKAKLNQCQMRFYNVVGRQNMLLMMQVTQPFEDVARNFLTDDAVHTSIGASLGPETAEDWVAALDRMLERDKIAYVHCGDDSWVAVRTTVQGVHHVLMFALDCTSFDLTQHADVTLAVHEAIHAELHTIDPVSAGLWFALMRERRVVVAGNLTYTFLHAGPSGMPLQSKVNDMLMEVLLKRVAVRFEELPEDSPWSVESADVLEAICGRVVAEEGRKMGFKVRLEQFSVTQCSTIRDAIRETPFLYVGYYFYVAGDAWEVGDVRVVCDLPRTLAQLPYPTIKWVESESALKSVLEPVRLSSIYLAAGTPTRGLEVAFTAWGTRCLELLDEAIIAAGEGTTFSVEGIAQQGVLGPALPKSLKGLRQAVKAKMEGSSPQLDVVQQLAPVGPVRGAQPVRLPDKTHRGKKTTRVHLGRRPPLTKLTSEEREVRLRARQALNEVRSKHTFTRGAQRHEMDDDDDDSYRTVSEDEDEESYIDDFESLYSLD